MRLFVAIELPDNLKDRLVAMKGAIPEASWVKRDAFHLTLSFLGEVEAERLPAIKAALEHVQSAPFTVTLRGAGRFPPKGLPRVIWVGVEHQPALLALQRHIEGALVPLGFPPEDRPFSGHITLARIKSDVRREVEAYLVEHRDFRAEPFRVTEFHLIESTLTPQGAKYRNEAAFSLQIS